jgi:hypothetical protein
LINAMPKSLFPEFGKLYSPIPRESILWEYLVRDFLPRHSKRPAWND